MSTATVPAVPLSVALAEFRVLLDAGGGVNRPDHVVDLARSTINYLGGSVATRARYAPTRYLEARWYASVERDNPDYGVYRTDAYLAELFGCWIVYSRKYLAALERPSSLPPDGVVRTLGDVRSIIDVGCGLGLTTRALRTMYPRADVAGTELPGTTHYRLAELVGAEAGFTLAGDIADLGTTDLVLASEYFEHFPAPIAHLRQIIRLAQPRILVVANAFTARSIGHFPTYSVDGRQLTGRATSRRFADTLIGNGYRRLPTSLWNNRPTIWVRG